MTDVCSDVTDGGCLLKLSYWDIIIKDAEVRN